MKNRKRPRIATGASVAGTVVRSIDGRIVVETDAGAIVARRALSCLLEPLVSDLVLVVANGDKAWVLAILERQHMQNATMSFPGNLTVNGESVRVIAKKELELIAPASVLLSERLRVRAVAAECEMGAVRFVASTIETIADRLSQKVRNAFRIVTGREQLRAEHIDYAAEKNAVLRGENAIVTAEHLVKMDGKQIHVG